MSASVEQESFKAPLEALLTKDGSDLAISNAIMSGIVDAERESISDKVESGSAFNLRIKHWVLRREDLSVAEGIGIVGGLMTAAMGPGGIAGAAIIAALTSFAKMCWAVWRKGATLSRPEVTIIGLLEVRGSMSLEELTNGALEVAGISSGDVQRALMNLSQIELRDGKIVSLVRQDSSGIWKTQSL